MNTTNEIQDYLDEIYDPHPIGAIELLGYAKNHIVEAKGMEVLPKEYQTALINAYHLLDMVQEYLFEN